MEIPVAHALSTLLGTSELLGKYLLVEQFVCQGGNLPRLKKQQQQNQTIETRTGSPVYRYLLKCDSW